MTVPAPPHCEHGWEIENRPWPWLSMPRPWHRGQTRGVVPGLAPVPEQVVHVEEVDTDSGTCAPSTAWSKAMRTSASRSRPRSGRGRVEPPVRPAPPPPPPNRLLRMSEKPPTSNPPPAAPPGAPPRNAPENGFSLAWSYCLRLSASPSTSYACEISLKRSSAPASLLVSG